MQTAIKLKDKKIAKFKRVLNFLGNLVSIPLMIITLCLAASILIGTVFHTAPMLAGHSIISIASGSMENSGFKKGDITVVTKIDTKALKKGDIIAYYRYGIEKIKDHVDDKEYLDADNYSSNIPFDVQTIFGIPSESLKEAGSANKIIIFHEIVDSKVDSDGKIWFQTKGSSVPTADEYYICEDYVLGKYPGDDYFLISAIKLVYSKDFYIWLLAIPTVLIALIMAFKFAGNIKRAILEKDVLEGRRKLSDSICVRNNVGFGMTNKTKYKVLAMATDEERLYYIPLLWKNAENPQNVHKYYLRKKLYLNRYHRLDEIKDECAEMIKNGVDSKTVVKYYEKETAKANKELEKYQEEIRERQKRAKTLYKAKLKDKKQK